MQEEKQEIEKLKLIDFNQHVNLLMQDLGVSIDQGTSHEKRRLMQKAFGKNELFMSRPAPSLLQCIWKVLKSDRTIQLLSLATIIDLIVTGVKTSDEGGGWQSFVDTGAILTALLVVIAVGAGEDWRRAKQFVQLSQKQAETWTVTLKIDGQMKAISATEILLGDVLRVGPGDILPGDGFIAHLDSPHLALDESQWTGESKPVIRPASDAVMSRTAVVDGSGYILITAVGKTSSQGRLQSLMTPNTSKPLKHK